MGLKPPENSCRQRFTEPIKLYTRILLSIWASPVIIHGAIGALFLYALRQIHPVRIYTHPKLPYAWSWMFYIRPNTQLWRRMEKIGMAGWSRGNTIVIREDVFIDRPAAALHELRHAWQAMTLGAFQPLLYTIISRIYRHKYGRKLGYFLNPFEQDAYRFSGESELLEQKIQESKMHPTTY
jgi:hypothetical protein